MNYLSVAKFLRIAAIKRTLVCKLLDEYRFEIGALSNIEDHVEVFMFI